VEKLSVVYRNFGQI